MSARFTRLIFAFFVIVLLAACTFPSPTQQPSEASPTPNQTMTALFQTPLPTNPLPTKTLPSVITATSQPTVEPSATLAPTSTSTSVPPTSTPVPPTATSKPPTPTLDTSHRPGTSFTAQKLAKSPVIDGDWTDFPQRDYAAQAVVFGKQNWTGSDDLSASFRITWDSTYLYVAAKVRDDVYAQNATGADIFKGDSLEILLDTNISADFFVTKTDSDDYQLGISPGRPDVNGTRSAWLWQPTSVAGARSQVKIAATRNESVHLTRYEAAIPWSILGVTPKSGMHFGFVLSVSDNDNTSKNEQQTMVSSDKNRDLFDPTSWNDLVLR